MSTDAQDILLKQLKNPFDEKFVKWRVGATNADKTKGIALAYIDSREVMKRLDEVCGINNWRKQLQRFDGGFTCRIYIRIDGEWIERDDAGEDTNMSPVKGGASDAFKRAAANWGIGRYLYYLPSVWVPIAAQGKSYVLAEIPELPSWAKHDSNIENWQDVAELELDASAGFDEQGTINNVIANLEKIKQATTPEELDEVVEQLTSEERIGLASQISEKTKELLDGKPKTQPANN